MDLEKVQNIYFIGIGGIGMSAIALYFAKQGKNVAGYDRVSSSITNELLKNDVKIYFDDDVNCIPNLFLDASKTIVIYTPAITNTHTQLRYFKKNGFVVLKRADILGEITKNSFCLAVAGTHGKTTTSSILGHIMQVENATAFLGGIAENYNSNLILGSHKISVVEADEFDRSFLKLSPNIACITSTDADHLDIYKNHQELLKAFQQFADKVSDKIIVAKGLPINGLTYAINEDADYKAYNIKVNNGAYTFDVITPNSQINNITLNLAGKHNVMNALAALAMADVYGVPLIEVKKRLATFKGVQRRFSYKIKTDDFVLIDDYAHHPTEIKAVHNSVREMYPDKKVLVVFQPHLFSRTKDFADDFAKELSNFDALLLLEVYPARELPIKGVDANWLLSKVSLKEKQLTTKSELVENIKNTQAQVIVMLGAGDIGLLVDEVKEKMLNFIK